MLIQSKTKKKIRSRLATSCSFCNEKPFSEMRYLKLRFTDCHPTVLFTIKNVPYSPCNNLKWLICRRKTVMIILYQNCLTFRIWLRIWSCSSSKALFICLFPSKINLFKFSNMKPVILSMNSILNHVPEPRKYQKIRPQTTILTI